MIHFLVPDGHAGMIREYLDLWGLDVASRFDVVDVENLPSLSRYPAGTYVFAALDQLSPAMTHFVSALLDGLRGRPDVRILNDPTRAWQRAQLLHELYQLGHNEFRAVPISTALTSLRFPVFVRDWRSHDGALSPLLYSPAQVEAAIGRVLLQGRPADDLLLVEFCDTADEDGYYRKYAAFVVGGHIVPRTLSYSRNWMLKFQGSEFSRAMVEEELDYVLTNPHEPALREIFSLAGVDYGRIDYAMKDGRIQTWEINLNPTIGRGRRPSTGRISAEFDAVRRPGKEHFYRRFREAWEAVDLDAPNSAPIDARIPDDIRQAARSDVEARAVFVNGKDNGPLATLRRVLRPAKSVVYPLAAPVLYLIGRAARMKAARNPSARSR